jgi:hypothetical protein
MSHLSDVLGRSLYTLNSNTKPSLHKLLLHITAHQQNSVIFLETKQNINAGICCVITYFRSGETDSHSSIAQPPGYILNGRKMALMSDADGVVFGVFAVLSSLNEILIT